jgi:hypothetical protein
MSNTNCQIWKTPCEAKYSAEHDLSTITSWRAGGRYKIDSLTALSLTDLAPAARANLSDYIYEANARGEVPLISKQDIENARSKSQRPLRSRLERLLTEIGARSRYLGDEVLVPLDDGGIFAAAASALNGSELDFMLNALKADDLVTRVGVGVRVTPVGYSLLADLRGKQGEADRVFVAMWFDPSLDQPFLEGFYPAIKEAGYEPLRIDKKDHNNKIDDEIVAEIRRSRFMVADFTCAPQKVRGGVYFEAGFAQGLGLPVIWTCREDSIADLHFDTRQYNHIVWKQAADLKAALQQRIIATLGQRAAKP